MNVLVWLRSDLRLADNPALAVAAERGAVLPLHLLDPEEWQRPERAGRHWAFRAETLACAREEFAAAGLPLVVRSGPAQEVLARLIRAQSITIIVSTPILGCAWSAARDSRLAAWARTQGIEWVEVAEGPAPALQGLRAIEGVEPGLIPAARALGVAEDPCPHRQLGGAGQAWAGLESYLARRFTAGSGSPVGGERLSPRLSAHLAVGAIAEPAVRNLLEADAGPAARRLLQRLAQRRRLRLAPLAAPPPCVRGPEGAGLLPSRLSGPQALAAFAQGQTGLPFLDASLRALRASGWANLPARRLMASAGVQLLGLDWHGVGQVLARMMLDYDPALHWAHMAQIRPDARAPNPVVIGQTHDLDGTFTRRWLPELAQVPGALIHCPWRWDGARAVLGRRYPEPLVDPGGSRPLLQATVPRKRAICTGPLLMEGPPRGGQLQLDL